jgi:hypothetical protein
MSGFAAANSMSRIVIHIGTHKTATTHIQDTFFRNRALLKRHGVVFPRIGHTRGQHGLASAWIRLPFPYGIRDARRAWARLARTQAGSDHTVFVSSEELSRLRPARVDMAELRSLVAPFDEVRIVCTLRNQASFIQSVYQQVSDDRNPGGWSGYLASALERKLVEGLALDYNALYRHMRSGFAADEIRLLAYDDARRQPGGIVGAMLETIGCDLPPDRLEPWEDRNSNVSPPALATFAANAAALPDHAPPRLVHIMAQSLAATTDPGRRNTIFTRAEVQQVADAFVHLNEELEAAVAEHQPGFRVGPMLGEAGLLYRGGLTDEFWIDACRRLRAGPRG